ncbi:MAG: SDR family oxidoreductase [Chloroflexi bacterium]|nr:SDR family oxidoreductase [Chloroflexota bacterium]MBV9600424.1 SDR family oxidoreductase [Chloroflexota bacterium]
MRLRDRVVIVTGGGKGIGLRYVRGLAAEGATIVVAEIDEAAAEHAASEVRAVGNRAMEVPTDVSDEASVRRMVERTISEFGTIDVLINNAARFAAAWDERGPSDELTVEQWDRMFAVNVRGTWLCCKHVVPHMRERGGGSIINVSSGTAWKGSTGFLHYVTSKAAIAGMTRALAREYGADGRIRVNCIAPGSTESETLPPAGDAEHMRVFSQRIMQRPEVPEDLVGTALFLASDDSAFVTGQTIHVDGGSVLS